MKKDSCTQNKEFHNVDDSPESTSNAQKPVQLISLKESLQLLADAHKKENVSS